MCYFIGKISCCVEGDDAMTTMQTIFYAATLVLGLAALCLFLKLRVQKCSAQATVSKAFVSVFFILSWIVTAYIKGMPPFSAFVGAGLVLGLLGDIWLDLKFCYAPDNDFYTKMGFLSFAVGHIFYCAAIVFGVSVFKPVAILPAVGVALVGSLAVFFGEKAMKLEYGAFKIIATLYGAVLIFMASFAFFTALFAGFGQNRNLVVLAIGGVLFLLSDLILSGTYFGQGKSRPVDVVTNHALYYAAQFVIAASVLFI